MRMIFLFILISFASFVCHGAVYMEKDKFGNITYSDTPLPNGTKIDVPEVTQETSEGSNVTSVTTTTSTEENAVVAENILVHKDYVVFLIQSPVDQATIQNQATIPVDIKIDPPLQEGDKILLLLDNKPYGAPAASTRFELADVERGTHQLSAVLLDANQRVIKESNSVIIYVHRVTLNSPTRIQAPKPIPVTQTIIKTFKKLLFF